ncbi:MAG TPA: PKD domain-containing protein, partial [Flavobacteriales bacterium]
EVPYNSADWASLERSLDGNKARLLPRAGLIAGLLLGGLIVGGATWYVMADRHTPEGAAQPAGTAEAATTQAVTPPYMPSATNTPAAPIGDRGTGTSEDAGTADSRSAANDPATNPAQPASPSSGPAPGNGTQTAASAAAPAKASTTKAGDAAIVVATAKEGCSGNTITFRVENMPDNGIYLWNFGDGSFSNKPDPEHVFSKPGRYQVMLSMSAPGVGTIHNKPTGDAIIIHEVPKAAFHAMKQEFDGHIPSMHFENRSMGGTKYHWDFGDGGSSTIAHPDHVYKKKGVYQAELTVVNAAGCEDKTIREVRVERDYNLDAPASFSPNGDGTDEGFIPAALRDLGVEFTLMIYNTQGDLLYQTNDASKPWLGKPNNRGEVCAPGEYVWVADIRESLHLSETFTGKVKLAP